MKRGEEKPRDDAADEAEFGPRLEAARELMRQHAGYVEILLDDKGQITGSEVKPRYVRGGGAMKDMIRDHKYAPRGPRIFKDPFFGEV